MITHGNKLISEIVYARKASEGGGAVRLTNIIRGARVVFGGLKPSFVWLEKATNAAILAAFGQTDGWQVIKATNAYLNALAETDPTKASALAGFINEDPMMVCSLGLQPQGVEMPIRKIVFNGSGYFNLGIAMNTIISLVAKMSTKTGRFAYFGSSAGSYNGVYQWDGNLWLNESSKVGDISVSDESTFIIENGFIDVQSIHASLPAYGSNDLLLGRVSSVADYSGKMHSIEIDARGQEYNFLPLIRNEQVELADIVSGKLAERNGSFTIAYILPDGTPWTPLNQTP